MCSIGYKNFERGLRRINLADKTSDAERIRAIEAQVQQLREWQGPLLRVVDTVAQLTGWWAQGAGCGELERHKLEELRRAWGELKRISLEHNVRWQRLSAACAWQRPKGKE